jgi:hypothetical protein
MRRDILTVILRGRQASGGIRSILMSQLLLQRPIGRNSIRKASLIRLWPTTSTMGIVSNPTMRCRRTPSPFMGTWGTRPWPMSHHPNRRMMMQRTPLTPMVATVSPAIHRSMRSIRTHMVLRRHRSGRRNTRTLAVGTTSGSMRRVCRMRSLDKRRTTSPRFHMIPMPGLRPEAYLPPVGSRKHPTLPSRHLGQVAGTLIRGRNLRPRRRDIRRCHSANPWDSHLSCRRLMFNCRTLPVLPQWHRRHRKLTSKKWNSRTKRNRHGAAGRF